MSKISGYKVHIPKGGDKRKQNEAVSELLSTKGGKLRKSDACTIVVFGKGRPVAAQRCTDRKLAATGQKLKNRKARARAIAKEVCKADGYFCKKGSKSKKSKR